MNVIVGSIQHESNTFCTDMTCMTDFVISYGDEVLSKIASAEYFVQQEIKLIPTLYANSVPSGIVSKECFGTLLARMLEGFPKDTTIDGVWLYLHGAMEVEAIGSGEAAILKSVREHVGKDAIIAVVLDFHANNDPSITKYANIICGYRTAPHVDMEETQIRTAQALVESLKKRYQPVSTMISVPIIITGDKVITAQEPMRSIIEKTLELETEDGILSASVFNGQPWVDAPNNGASALVVAKHRQNHCKALGYAKELSNMLWAARSQYRFQVEALAPKQAVETALFCGEVPVILSDSGDNTTAGAYGNSVNLLRDFMKYKTPKTLIAGITDPAVVDSFCYANPGEHVNIVLGKVFDPQNPLVIPVTFQKKGRLLGWDGEDAGDCVVLSYQAIDIIVTRHPCAMISKEIIESAGVRFSQYAIVVVKQGYLWPDLESRTAHPILALTPGASCEQIEEIPFQHVRRPSWPIDKDFEWKA